MGKNYSDNQHSIKNTKDLTMKQMFDIPAEFVSEQDEIYGVKTIDWEDPEREILGGPAEERSWRGAVLERAVLGRREGGGGGGGGGLWGSG